MAARLAAKRAGARARRGGGPGAARPQALLSRGVLAAAASAEPEVAYCQPEEVKGLLNKGYAFVDIRSFEEMEETNTKYGSKRFPLAAMNEDGDIVFNQFWLKTVKEAFPNAMSRIILVCDDGTDRSEIAFNKLAGEPNNYTAVKVLEGGFDAYVEAGLMTEKDLDPYRGREDGQTVFGQRSASGMWTGW